MIDRLIIYAVLVGLICLAAGGGYWAGAVDGEKACIAKQMQKTIDGAREDTAARGAWEDDAAKIAVENAGIEAANAILARKLAGGRSGCVLSGKWLRELSAIQ